MEPYVRLAKYIFFNIEHFFILTSILPKMLALLHLPQILRHSYVVQIAFLELFCLYRVLSVYLGSYSVPNEKLAFFSLHCSYDLHMPCKVHFWYCFVCTTISSVHVWIYSVPNRKLASKLTILYF